MLCRIYDISCSLLNVTHQKSYISLIPNRPQQNIYSHFNLTLNSVSLYMNDTRMVVWCL